MTPEILVYGATGYTAKLIVALARDRGVDLCLAGRNEAGVHAIADANNMPAEIFGLDDRPNLESALAKVAAVLHCAGPFSRTSEPMVDACIRTGTHYLDITGEIDVFEACAARSVEAAGRGVMLLPGVGFDVVPSDCLAAHTASKLASPQHLTLVISGQNPDVARHRENSDRGYWSSHPGASERADLVAEKTNPPRYRS